MVAFLSYGSFRETFVFLLIFPSLTGMSGFVPENTALGCYLFFWGVLSFVMFNGTLRKNGALMAVFGTLWLLFFPLLLGSWTRSAPTSMPGHFTGYEGILCSLLALYTASAETLNEAYGRSTSPSWPAKPKE